MEEVMGEDLEGEPGTARSDSSSFSPNFSSSVSHILHFLLRKSSPDAVKARRLYPRSKNCSWAKYRSDSYEGVLYSDSSQTLSPEGRATVLWEEGHCQRDTPLTHPATGPGCTRLVEMSAQVKSSLVVCEPVVSNKRH